MSKDDQSQPARYGHKVYRSNPSVVEPETRTRRKQLGNAQQGVLIDEDTNDIIGRGAAVMYKFEEVDQERFVKLFLAGLKQAIGMSKAGLAVFELVYYQLQDKKDRDTVLLAPVESGMSASTFHRGVRELIDREFLYRSPYPGSFWVNIRYLFNGDRLAFVQAYQLTKKKPASPQLGLFNVQNEANNVLGELEGNI
jgi:hypothetical protein